MMEGDSFTFFQNNSRINRLLNTRLDIILKDGGGLKLREAAFQLKVTLAFFQNSSEISRSINTRPKTRKPRGSTPVLDTVYPPSEQF